MKKFSGSLSRRYGTALFESISDIFTAKKNDFENASDTIRLLSTILNKNVVQFFKNPTLNAETKNKILEQILASLISDKSSKFYHIMFDFLSIIIKNQRMDVIHPILEFYSKLSDQYLGIVRSSVVSAKPLSKDALNDIESAVINSIKQKKVVFSNFVDESLQSGFLLKIGSVDIDASLKSFLSKLQESVH